MHSSTFLLLFVLLFEVDGSKYHMNKTKGSRDFFQNVTDEFLKSYNMLKFRPPDDEQVTINWNKSWQFVSQMTGDDIDMYRMKLGSLGTFIRMFRQWMRRDGFDIEAYGYFDRYPVPPLPRLPWDIQTRCTDFANFTDCIDSMADHKAFSIHDYQYFDLFGSEIKHDGVSVNGSDENTRQMDMSDTFFESIYQDFSRPVHVASISVMYLLCYASIRKFPLLDYLPYCDLGAENAMFKYPYRYAGRYMGLGWNTSRPTIDKMDPVPYRCALLTFCPDACCGRVSSSTKKCRMSELNDCKVGDDCKMYPKRNLNFYGQVRNRWNLTCECKEPGAFYDKYMDMCIGVDRCRDPKNVKKCADKGEGYVCVGYLETFDCVCSIGYYYEAESNKCLNLTTKGDWEWKGAALALEWLPLPDEALTLIPSTLLLLSFTVFILC